MVHGIKSYSEDPLRSAALAISLLLHASTALLFHYAYLDPGQQHLILQEFAWHFRILLALSAALSVLLRFFRKNASLLLIFKIGLFFLITYPLGLEVGLFLALLLTVLTEIFAYLPAKTAVLYCALCLGTAGTLGKPGSAFNYPRDSAEIQELITVGLTSLLCSFLLLIYRQTRIKLSTEKHKTGHLNSVISQLSDANLDFQRYVHSVEYSAVQSERRRISSEIHDTVGYSLTNILMTLEAVSDLIDRDSRRAHEALERSIREAQNCLEETRRSMQELRSKEQNEAVGLQALAHLVRSFSEATGIRVKMEFGNAPNSFGSRIDLVLFRIIQEGLTNAFRHGQADTVRIALWIENSELLVSILDNGRGTSQIVDGIGISGMRERVENIKGTISFKNYPDGFSVKAVLPLTEDDNGQNTGSPRG
ncbi:sensor histidine kinase [Marispirochaeta aestuarii]|uniref:sensor histidine kinase n=1 Tax=Marispirochaeta aestuarii TaxID=1963862 RepID=UPI002ABE25E2|nr:sensor histidine kinase [Marispirochaeta aestuarii]